MFHTMNSKFLLQPRHGGGFLPARRILAITLLAVFWILLPLATASAEEQGITPAELSQLLQRGEATVVNCMSWLECMDSRIPGSICLYDGREGEKGKLERIAPDRNRRLVFYCETDACRMSGGCLAEALKEGYRQVSILKGGFPAWKEAGFAVESVQRVPRVAQLSVRAKDLKGWLDQDRPLTLLDVRDPEAYRQNHIHGAINIPLEVLHVRYHEIPLGQPLVVIDNRGFRSFFTASYLKRKGFDTVRLFGGMQKWQAFLDKEWKPKKKKR